MTTSKKNNKKVSTTNTLTSSNEIELWNQRQDEEYQQAVDNEAENDLITTLSDVINYK